MYLILAEPNDPCAIAVAATLQRAGHSVWHLANPLLPPWSLQWQFDANASVSELRHADGRRLSADELQGVLVLEPPLPDSGVWSAEDYAYVAAETRAALLGWLHALPVTVLGRLPAHLWFKPAPPLLAWRPLLQAAGLPLTDMLISNDPKASRDFALRVVVTPLTNVGGYLVTSAEAWDALERVQSQAPVCLSPTYGECSYAVVVGEVVVWAGPRFGELEAGLRHFVQLSGLSFASVALALVGDVPTVVEVSTSLAFARCDSTGQEHIVAALARLLEGEAR